MLARTYGPRFDRFPCYCQPKLNGVRALYQHTPMPVFQSRDEKVWFAPVLQHLRQELDSIRDFLGSSILDGELYVHGWRLQQINGAVAVNRHFPREDTPDVCFHVFDIVDPSRKFSERWLDAYNTLQQLDLLHVKAVPTAICSSTSDVENHFLHYTSLGYEGIMLRPDGPYEFGVTPHGTQKRSEFLWKYKSWQDAEFMCVDVTRGEGKADIGIGALILAAVSNPQKLTLQSVNQPDMPRFNVGTGFSDDERRDFMSNPPIGRLIKVRFIGLSADGIPLNPSFLAAL